MEPQHEVTAPQYAGFWRRAGAYIIDAIVLWIFLSAFASIFGIPIDQPAALDFATGTFSFLGVVITWLYFSVMESSSKQATLGKMAIKIIVTDENGKRMSFGRATGRHFAKIISGIILMIGYLMIFWTQKRQGLHDIIAKTLVIRA